MAVGIDRSSKSIIKGPRLQKLRVSGFLLDAIINDEKNVHCGIEYIDDAAKIEILPDGKNQTFEQNKDVSHNITIASSDFLKTMCGYLDTWLKFSRSPKMKFVFYTPASIGSESNSEKSKKLGVKFKKGDKIVEDLSNKTFDKHIITIGKYITDYYEEITKKHDKIYYFDEIKEFKIDDWEIFLSCITWFFNASDNGKLKDELLIKAKSIKSKLELETLSAETILSLTIELVESKALESEFLVSTVSVDELTSKLYENRIYSGKEKIIDPLHKQWDKIRISDERDLKKKFRSVSSSYPESNILEHQEDLHEARFELREMLSNKQERAFLYGIYKQAKRKLKSAENNKMSPKEINELLDEIIDKSESNMLERKKNYHIPLCNKQIIKDSLYILFEDCYIAFD